jgi:hypothetical protein
MDSSTPYNDLRGKVSADISDLTTTTNNLKELATSFGIETTRYEPIGLRLYGVNDFLTYIIAIDNDKSTENKEHLVEIEIDSDDPNLILKNMDIVTVDRFKQEYLNKEIDETINLEDE